MDSKRKGSLIGILMFFFDGLIGIIYHLFFYYAFELVIFSFIFTIISTIVLILYLIRKLPPTTRPYFLYAPPLLWLVITYFFAIWSIFVFIYYPILFLALVYGLSIAFYTTYGYLTRDE